MDNESKWKNDNSDIEDKYDQMVKIRNLQIGTDVQPEEIPDNIIYVQNNNNKIVLINKYGVEINYDNELKTFVEKQLIRGIGKCYYKKGDFLTREYVHNNKNITIDFSRSKLRTRTGRDWIRDFAYKYIVPKGLLEL